MLVKLLLPHALACSWCLCVCDGTGAYLPHGPSQGPAPRVHPPNRSAPGRPMRESKSHMGDGFLFEDSSRVGHKQLRD